MNKEYKFYNEEPICFDDEKTVRQLIEYASAKFGYNNLLTAEFATLLSEGSGLIPDTSLKCCQAIDDNDTIYPASYIPDTLCYIKDVYMENFIKTVGISNPFLLRIYLDDVYYRVCVNGEIKLSDLQKLFIKSGCTKSKELNAKVEIYPYEREMYIYNLNENRKEWDMTLKEFDRDLLYDGYTEWYIVVF